MNADVAELIHSVDEVDAGFLVVCREAGWVALVLAYEAATSTYKRLTDDDATTALTMEIFLAHAAAVGLARAMLVIKTEAETP